MIIDILGPQLREQLGPDTESEKVLNVPSILRVNVMVFLNVDHLGGDIFYSKIC